MNRQSQWITVDVEPDADSSNLISGSCNRYACLGDQLTGGTCIASACLLTTGYGRIITSTDPTGGAAAWTRTRIYGTTNANRGYWGLSDPVCFSTSLCYVLGARGDLLVSTDPFGSDPASWESVPLPHLGQLEQLDCPSARQCLVTSAKPSGRPQTAITVGNIAVATAG